MKRVLFVLIFVFSLSSVRAQTLTTTASPEQVGMSSTRLERLNGFMQRQIDEEKMAGGISLVYRKGELVHLQTYGYRDLEQKLPMTEDTIFRIYSMSKPITSVAVMMLYEEGHFLLSTPVSDILPEFAGLQVYDESAPNKRAELVRPVTIEDLLTHTSGLTYGEILGMRSPVDSMYAAADMLSGNPNLEDFVTDLTAIPLRFQPGERWHYSVSIDVLGRVVEVLSGQSFDEFLQERIFDPLGMTDTGFSVPAEDLDRFSKVYSIDREKGLTEIQPFGGAMSFTETTLFSGGGGLVSTVHDYLQFARIFLGKGRVDSVQVLSPKTVELMMQNHLEVPFNSGEGFGLGGAVVLNVGEAAEIGSVGTFYWGGAANTQWFVDPEEDLIAFAWTQMFSQFSLNPGYRIAVYQAIVE
ncbi:beta-lactamase family protein [bacterium]|nr:beta-lactamase family protein [bacterium]